MRFERHVIAIPSNCVRQIMQIKTINLHYIHPNNHVILGICIDDYSMNWTWNGDNSNYTLLVYLPGNKYLMDLEQQDGINLR
jgi:hypothetical protein